MRAAREQVGGEIRHHFRTTATVLSQVDDQRAVPATKVGSPEDVAALTRVRDEDADQIVREHAAWARRRLATVMDDVAADDG